MNLIIEAKKPAIIALCRRYGILKLDLFEFATGPKWDPERSNSDFIVDFDDDEPEIARKFVRFADALDALLGRDVDLTFEEESATMEFWTRPVVSAPEHHQHM